MYCTISRPQGSPRCDMEQTTSRGSNTRHLSESEAEPSAASSSSQGVNMRKVKPTVAIHERGGRRFSDTKDPSSGTLSGVHFNLNRYRHLNLCLFSLACCLYCKQNIDALVPVPSLVTLFMWPLIYHMFLILLRFTSISRLTCCSPYTF